MMKFNLIESNAYHHGDKTGVAYYAETATEARTIIKSKMNAWITYFVTVDGVTFPDYVWTTTDKLDKLFA